MVDKNLFLYDLAVVAIMKNEGSYVKEWLDYHLLAGVDHFYIYDNESPDNQKEVLQPYIDAGIVTYTFYPGKPRHYEAYNDAIHRFKFCCRYMAFIDGDEFIFPKSKPTITEIVDEVLPENSNAGGLVANWQLFGSNHLDKADYSVGVLERFLRRAPSDYAPKPGILKLPGGNAYVKTIANPRRIKYCDDAHHVKYLLGFYSVNEQGKFSVFYNLFPTINYPVMFEKIVVNHYFLKSQEEYERRSTSGYVSSVDNNFRKRGFTHERFNEEFDDSIVKYRDARYNALIPAGGGVLKTFFNVSELIISGF